MLLKIKTNLCSRDYYKIAIIIICLNSVFELVFKYQFQADIKMEMIYFLVLGVASIVAIKDMVIKNKKNFLSVFYCFWPIFMLFIYFCSTCKISLFPLLVSSFIILFGGRYKQKLIKISVSAFMTVFIVLIVLFIYFFPLIRLGMNKPEVIKTVYSFDNKYIMVLEETDLGATGGDVYVYFGRNIDFGLLGRYMPEKIKYYGHWGEIIRYKKENGDILQYKVTLYGETGRIEENYYFVEDNTIYHTRLEELYSSPISYEKETDISSRTFNEGENMYKSLDELNIVFDTKSF